MLKIDVKQTLNLKMEIALIAQMSNILAMSNAQLFEYLKKHEGTGKGEQSAGFSIRETMGVERNLDIKVKGFFIEESSSNYIDYGGDSGEKRRNFGGKMSSIRWILKMRETMLKATTAFILRYHHDFFWGQGSIRVIHPTSQRESLKYINNNLSRFNLEKPFESTLFSRLIKNKVLDIQGTVYPMSFFFCSSKLAHPHPLFYWINEILEEESKMKDEEMISAFYEKSGVWLNSRRTMNKYKKTVLEANQRIKDLVFQEKPKLSDEEIIGQVCSELKIMITPELIEGCRAA